MALVFGASGVTPSLRGQPSMKYALQAGEVTLIPAGTWVIRPGNYCIVQQYNPITTCWENMSDTGTRDNFWVNSDGVNWRVANTTGCVVGALITNAGSGYTGNPACTAASGGATFVSILGGAINTTVTVVKGGTNYVYPPQVQIAAPPAPGVPATAYCTLSGGAVSTITVTNQGAGYLIAPAVTLVNDPRDTTGSGASATTTLTGSGTFTAILVSNHGTPLTSVPNLTPTGTAGSSAAATAIMNFTITAYGISTAGAGYTAAAGHASIMITPTATAGTAAYTNPDYQTGITRMRACLINAVTSGAGAITTTQQVIDGGCYQAVPGVHDVAIPANDAIVTTAAVLSLSVGGTNDSFLMLAV